MFSKQDIEKYFLAEKQLSLVFIVIGSIAVILAVVFFFVLKTSFHKGAAVPLLIIGLIQLIASIVVYKKTDNDRIRNVYAYDMNPGQLKNEELPRIKTVVKKFAVIKWAETASIAGGLALIFFFRANADKTFWYGLGLTLAIQAMLLFLADYSSEKRAIQYKNGVERFVEKFKD